MLTNSLIPNNCYSFVMSLLSENRGKPVTAHLYSIQDTWLADPPILIIRNTNNVTGAFKKLIYIVSFREFVDSGLASKMNVLNNYLVECAVLGKILYSMLFNTCLPITELKLNIHYNTIYTLS